MDRISSIAYVARALRLADLLWWWRADRRARPLRHALRWRLLIGLFMGGQIALALWILRGRVPTAASPRRPPPLLSAAAHLWHLLPLPAGWAPRATTGLLFG